MQLHTYAGFGISSHKPAAVNSRLGVDVTRSCISQSFISRSIIYTILTLYQILHMTHVFEWKYKMPIRLVHYQLLRKLLSSLLVWTIAILETLCMYVICLSVSKSEENTIMKKAFGNIKNIKHNRMCWQDGRLFEDKEDWVVDSCTNCTCQVKYMG